MHTVDTVLSPREILNRIYQRLRYAYAKVLEAKPGDVKADSSIMQDIEIMESLVDKLSFSFIKKLRDDANVDSKSYEKLKEIENLLNDMVRDKGTAIRESHYIYRSAKHLRNVVRGNARKTRKKGAKELGKVQKEKKALARKEIEAREKAGKR